MNASATRQPRLRVAVLFLIAWGLLFMSRLVDAVYYFEHYRLAKALAATFAERPPRDVEDQTLLASLVEKERENLQDGVDAILEIALLGVLCLCFLYTNTSSRKKQEQTAGVGQGSAEPNPTGSSP